MKIFIPIILLMASMTAFSGSENSAVIEETNFHKLSQEMKKNKMGLVMMLHAEYCSYCEMMDEKILSPMVRSKDYEGRVYIRKLQIDKEDTVVGFNGKEITAFDLANTYDSQMTPTLVFLDYKGEEKALNVIGINSIDLFNATVDEQIDELVTIVKKY